MREIRISDITIGTYSADEKTALTFREKIEVAKLLDRLGVSVIELGNTSGNIADNLLVKSVAAAVKNSTVAVTAGFDEQDILSAWDAVRSAVSPRLQICAAVSTARMEYVYHKKADKMLDIVAQSVAECKRLCGNVEFIAEDATRADTDYLCRILTAAIDAGATVVTVCDTAGIMLPDEFGRFIGQLYERVPALNGIDVGVRCSNALGVADACAVSALKSGICEIKATCMPRHGISLKNTVKLFSLKSDTLDVCCKVNTTEINRILQSIERLFNKVTSPNSPFEDGVRQYPDDMTFSADDTIDDIVRGADFLGYTLDETDKARIWKAFSKIAQRKDKVSIGELEAIIASEAMQVPPTYTLENYVVTTGNAIDILAHIKLKKGDEHLDGLSLGDGPIDAAFLAIEKITGHHYELDDFQLQAITEGREAMGQTVVKLRSGGKVYSGRGISTDIIGSGVAAYVNALNKILYEEENV